MPLVVAQRRGGALAVGAVPYRYRGERLAIVAKAAFAMARGGGLRPVAAPEPMSLDQPSDLAGSGPDELRYASDFVPRKAGCDVVLVGHAQATRGATHAEVRLRAGEVSRAVVAEARGSAARIPLSMEHLRGEDGARAAAVGPLRPAVERRAEHPVDFDFAAYSCASPQQRAAQLGPGDALELAGCLRDEVVWRARLPTLAPRVLVELEDGGERASSLALDTVWIDADRRVVVLAFRGSVDVAVDDVARVLLEGAPDGDDEALARLRRELPRAVFLHAVREEDFTREPPPEDALRLAKLEAWADAPPEPELPLERYAELAATLAEEREPRAEVLARYDLDEEAWLLEERAWLERVAQAAMDGEDTLALELGRLLAEARAQLARPGDDEQPLEEHAEIAAAMERAADPARLLRERGLTLARWIRAEERWARLAAADPKVAAELEAALAAARAALGPDEEGPA